jgi:uncharacterized membrane-anchored protein YhcB (DUF1043 family)
MSKPMVYTLLIVGFLILSAGLIFALKTFKPMHFNLIAGLIAVIITAFALFGRLMQEKSSSEKSDLILKSGEKTGEKVDSLKIQNIELNTKLEKQSETIDNLRQENTDLHSKLAQSSNEIYSKITGGDSYCEVIPAFFGEVPEFHLGLVGKVPLENVLIIIDDLARKKIQLDKIQISKDTNLEYLNELFMQYKYSYKTNLRPNVGQKISIPIEAGQNEIDLLIRIYQDNGEIEQTIKISNFRSLKERKIKIEMKKDGVLLPRN